MRFDPATTLTPPQIFKVIINYKIIIFLFNKVAASMTCFWLISFTFFVLEIRTDISFLGINPFFYPLTLTIFFIVIILNPFHIMYRTSR